MKMLSSIATYVMFLCVAVLAMSGVSYAQSVSPIPTSDFVELIISSLGGISKIGAVGVASVVVKILIAAFNSELLGKQLDKMTGKFKLSVISLLSYVAGVLALITAGTPTGMALVHGTVVPLLVIVVNNFYKQFVEKKNEPAKIK